jgi:hypothetical protein
MSELVVAGFKGEFSADEVLLDLNETNTSDRPRLRSFSGQER